MGSGKGQAKRVKSVSTLPSDINAPIYSFTDKEKKKINKIFTNDGEVKGSRGIKFFINEVKTEEGKKLINMFNESLISRKSKIKFPFEKNINFDNIDLSGLDLSRVDFWGSPIFTNCKMDKVNFENTAFWKDTYFSECDLAGLINSHQIKTKNRARLMFRDNNDKSFIAINIANIDQMANSPAVESTNYIDLIKENIIKERELLLEQEEKINRLEKELQLEEKKSGVAPVINQRRSRLPDDVQF